MTKIIGIAGFSNSGKTTLITRLVAHFARRGVRTAVVKHDAHGHYKEAEGTDSSLYMQAGASAAVVVSPDAYVVLRREAIALEVMLSTLRAEAYELILVEGFKNGTHDKIAIFRDAEQAAILLALPQPAVAVAAPAELGHLSPALLPFLDLDNIGAIARWIGNRVMTSDIGS
jgi:molybdopterin-guanine dinucleotide biosynthesis protein B